MQGDAQCLISEIIQSVKIDSIDWENMLRTGQIGLAMSTGSKGCMLQKGPLPNEMRGFYSQTFTWEGLFASKMYAIS